MNEEALKALGRVVAYMDECETASHAIDEDVDTIRVALERTTKEQ